MAIRIDRKSTSIIGLVLISVLVEACNGSLATNSDGDFVTTAAELNIETDAIWDTSEVSVCWVDDNASNSQARNWVRDQISRTWEFVANIKFTGWGHCSYPAGLSQGISIKIADERPHTEWLGESLWGTGIEAARAVATLNFTYGNWNANCQDNIEYCVRAESAHEFGHLLGFAHEQNRDNTPPSCTDGSQGSDGNATFGDWDIHSIMNYCNPVWNNGGLLSSTDVAGTQHYYGMGPRYVAAISALTSSTL